MAGISKLCHCPGESLSANAAANRSCERLNTDVCSTLAPIVLFIAAF
jgi:hypothetical protein